MRAASLRAVRVVDAPAKLALLERLLGITDVPECIDRALTWLISHTGTQQAICALAKTDTGFLTGVGGHHVTASQVESVSVGLDDTGHPLVRAMHLPEPTLWSSTPDQGGAGPGLAAEPFGLSPCWAIPLDTRGAG